MKYYVMVPGTFSDRATLRQGCRSSHRTAHAAASAAARIAGAYVVAGAPHDPCGMGLGVEDREMRLTIMAELDNDDFANRGPAAVAEMVEGWLAEYRRNATTTIEADRWRLRDGNGNTCGTVNIYSPKVEASS